MTDQYQHKQNLHIVWLWWLAQASNLQKEKAEKVITHKVSAMHWQGEYMINASQELRQKLPQILNKFNISIVAPIIIQFYP